MRYAEQKMKLWTLALLLLASCGGSSDKDVKSPTPEPATVPAADASPVSSGDTPAPAADKLSEAECDGLFDHLFQIAVAGQVAALPPEEQPTAADIEKAKAQMRSQLMPDCQSLSRAELKYDCYMAASDRASIEACDKG